LLLPFFLFNTRLNFRFNSSQSFHMLKKSLFVFLSLVIVLAALSVTDNFSHLRNFAVWGVHSIHDHRTHPVSEVPASTMPQPWEMDSLYNKVELSGALLAEIDSNNTHAFLVFQDGKLLYEKYWDGYTPQTISGSFSAAKSIVSLLIGIALDEKKILSLDEPVSKYIDHFNTNGLEKVTIKHLLTMSSGTNYQESDKGYFSLNASAYYGDDMDYLITRMEKKEAPGVYWQYRSGDTQVLGLIVEKVFGKSISALVSERFMQPMGAETDALWLLDGEKKHEKAFCCFNAAARDYARFGQLVLNKGMWNGQQLVSSSYIAEATTPASFLKDREENDSSVDFYGYQYWMIDHKGTHAIAMSGLFGQYVYIIPEKNAVAVRLGNSKVVKPIHHHQPENFLYLDAAMEILR
jgi:CubicO group peptidase (beta-lactamase class C family)